MPSKTSGTKEWADYNINFQTGCKYGCRYCYAAYDAIARWGRVKDYETWCNPVHNEKAFKKFGLKLRKDGPIGPYPIARIMFPTSHDIYEENFVHAFPMLYSLLIAGNRVLITTKPLPWVIRTICINFKPWKEQIQFRFTITEGAISELAPSFWEPNAPTYFQRLQALFAAHNLGYKTSLSIEPYLENPLMIINNCESYVTESIWVGIMNPKKILPEFKEEYDKIKHIYTKSFILEHLNSWKEAAKGKLRLKDSITSMIDEKQRRLDI